MPPPGIAGAAGSFFGTSATMASVVISRPATEAVRILVLVHDLADHDGTISAGVNRDLAGRHLDRLAHDLDAVLLILVLGIEALTTAAIMTIKPKLGS
jgi:hypothetical protein